MVMSVFVPYIHVLRLIYFLSLFFFSSRRRHTRCALVTGVQTCALPISTQRSPPTKERPGHLRGPAWGDQQNGLLELEAALDRPAARRGIVREGPEPADDKLADAIALVGQVPADEADRIGIVQPFEADGAVEDRPRLQIGVLVGRGDRLAEQVAPGRSEEHT